MQYVLQVEQPGNSCQSINIDSIISGFNIYNCRSNAIYIAGRATCQ